MKNFIITAALGLFTIVGLASCQAVKGFFGGEEMVVTTAENVVEGSTAASVPVGELPENVRNLFPEGMDVVVASKSDLLSEDSPYIPLGGAMSDTAIGTAFDAAMHIGKTFIPALAGWEALLALGFKRKRTHYVKAAKALLPWDKNVDVGGALAGVTAALDMTHSSKNTEEVFEDEDEE